MADLNVRQLNDRVARTLKARAANRGVSLEEEVRSTLTIAVGGCREAFRRRAAALRAATTCGRGRSTDSARYIRKGRNALG
jgi:plasmid stability protein